MAIGGKGKLAQLLLRKGPPETEIYTYRINYSG